MTATKIKPTLPFGPLKQRDLMHCVMCNRGVMHAGQITFYRVQLQRYAVNLPAVQRQHGFEMMMGALGPVMGPDEDMATPFGEGAEVNVCEECAVTHCVASIHEVATQEDDE